MAVSVPTKVGERTGVSVTGPSPYTRKFHFGINVPKAIPADRGPALESDIKRVQEVVREVERKWSGG